MSLYLKNFILIAMLLASPSCKKSDDDSSDGQNLFDPDQSRVTKGDWYQPKPDTSWQIQLTEDLDTSFDVDLYDVDLFDTDQDVIDELHDTGAKVVCYFSAGSSEDWRDDYEDFPSAAIGKEMDGWPGENWLDIRNEDIAPIMLDRIALAVEKECDAVDPDNVNGYTNESGFDLTAEDQLGFNKWLANTAHSEGLAIALKNDGEQIEDLIKFFDMSVNEQCHKYDECEPYYEFIENDKPVFNIEYDLTADEVCEDAIAEDFRTLIMPDNLDGSSRISCD